MLSNHSLPSAGGLHPLSASRSEMFLHTCESEGIAALLAHQLHQNPQLDDFPQALLEKLKVLELQSVAGDLRRQPEIKRVLSLFVEAGLDFIVLKGEALAHTLYPASYLRTRCDTDLLFRDKQATEKVWSILKAEGYGRNQTLEGEFVGYQYGCSKPLRSGLTITFDIHNQVSDFVWFARKFPFQALYANSIRATIVGQEVNVLSKPYALCHACLHRVSNKPHGTQDRLIWLYDIHLLCEALTENESLEFLAIVEEKGLAGICMQGILQAERYYGTCIQDSSRDRLCELATREPEGLSRVGRRSELYIRDFLANEGIVNKAKQLREHLLPSSAYMMGKYSIQHKWLLPYFYIKRIFLGAIKYNR